MGTREQLAEQGELLDQMKIDKEMLESTLELEVETYEILLERERNQAKQIIDNVKKQGCELDVSGGMLSKYATDALNSVHGVCNIIVNYEKTLDNPVGAIVYVHNEQQ